MYFLALKKAVLTNDNLLSNLVRDHDSTNGKAVSKRLGHREDVRRALVREVLVGPELASTTQSTL